MERPGSQRGLYGLALAALVLAAGPALAQGNLALWGSKAWKNTRATGVTGQVNYADSSVVPTASDANGNLGAYDPNRDRDQVWQYVGIIDRSTPGIVRPYPDSSSVLLTRGWNKMALVFYPTLKADSVEAAWVAVQIRGHYTAAGDSVGANPWRHWNGAAPAFTAGVGGAADTINAGQGYLNANFGTQTFPADSLARSGEFVVFVPAEAVPRGLWIPLVDRTGDWFSAPFTSVRVRLLKEIGNQAPSSGANPWGVALAPQLKVRLDLAGWR